MRAEERALRIGMNEAVFREVNERIQDLADRFEFERKPLALVCECGDPSCMQPISMKANEYAQLRAEPTHFAVLAGHENADVETVVERHDSYDVVEKHEGVPAALAEQTDPRT